MRAVKKMSFFIRLSRKWYKLDFFFFFPLFEYIDYRADIRRVSLSLFLQKYLIGVEYYCPLKIVMTRWHSLFILWLSDIRFVIIPNVLLSFSLLFIGEKFNIVSSISSQYVDLVIDEKKFLFFLFFPLFSHRRENG